MSARVIAVSNRKGGTGKTTTVVNLAASLTERGKRVLVVDLDTQGHAGLGFGVRAAAGEATAHDIFDDENASLTGAVRASVCPGVDVLPANRSFQMPPRALRPLALARALAPLASNYGAILIDTSPAADPLLVSALAAADHVLVPTQLHHLAVDGVGQFARAYFHVAASINDRLKGLSLLPVQIDLRITMQREAHATLTEKFGAHRLLAGIRTDVALAEAFGHGRPVRHHKPNTRAVTDFEILCDHVCRTVLH